MNVLQNLTDFYSRLSPESTYKEVVRGILTHLDEAADATIYDIADITNSSRTTVWRMVQKMGYDNYSDFRHALKQAVNKYTYYNRLIPADMAADETALVSHIADQFHQAADALRDHLSMSELVNMAHRLAGKNQINFYFPYQSSAMGSFQQNIFMSGRESCVYSLLPDMIQNAKTLNEQSCVICTTIEHAETQDFTELFRILKERKAEVIMASRKRSQYERYVDLYLGCTEEKSTILSEITYLDIYFYSLSEVYRKYYVGK